MLQEVHRRFRLVDSYSLQSLTCSETYYCQRISWIQVQLRDQFFAAMNGLTQWTGLPNVADFFPWLKWLDLQGLKRKTKRDMGKVFEIATRFVRERIEENEMGRAGGTKEMLDVLLEFEGDGNEDPKKLSDHHINIFMLVSL